MPPERWVGHWAMSLAREIFRIGSVTVTGREHSYTGTGLHGQPVRTDAVTILNNEDAIFMEESYHADEGD